jgi:hypothetical protein
LLARKPGRRAGIFYGPWTSRRPLTRRASHRQAMLGTGSGPAAIGQFFI